MQTTSSWWRWALVAAPLVLCACFPGANEQLGVPRTSTELAGFWLGLWHGLIFPLSFLVSLFKDGVQVYEVHNSGAWYNFGYLLGLASCFGGPGHGTGRALRRRR